LRSLEAIAVDFVVVTIFSALTFGIGGPTSGDLSVDCAYFKSVLGGPVGTDTGEGGGEGKFVGKGLDVLTCFLDITTTTITIITSILIPPPINKIFFCIRF
jgi:hypothetical protein